MTTIITIWYREFLNYIRDRARIVSSLVMSLMLMLVFTFALGDFDTSVLGIEPIQYMLPGIIATTIFMTSINGALSVITDKTEGFMKEFLVSPIKRSSIAIGKILGTATTAIIQGSVILVISPLFGMRYSFSDEYPICPRRFRRSSYSQPSLPPFLILLASLIASR